MDLRCCRNHAVGLKQAISQGLGQVFEEKQSISRVFFHEMAKLGRIKLEQFCRFVTFRRRGIARPSEEAGPSKSFPRMIDGVDRVSCIPQAYFYDTFEQDIEMASPREKESILSCESP